MFKLSKMQDLNVIFDVESFKAVIIGFKLWDELIYFNVTFSREISDMKEYNILRNYS